MITDNEIEAKNDEMQQINLEIKKLGLINQIEPGKTVEYNTAEEVLQSGELNIMYEIAYGEFSLLLMKKNLHENDKPLTLQHWIDLKRSELEEHRELQRSEGLKLTSFKYQPETTQ